MGGRTVSTGVDRIRSVDKGREINLTQAVNKDTITRGLRYSLATGNWGMAGTAGIRAGVSQAWSPAACAPTWAHASKKHECVTVV